MLKVCRISRSTKNRTSVKSFPGASVADCYDYFKPPLKNQPEEVIVHVGTNDLKTKSARETAEGIVDLVQWIGGLLPDVKLLYRS